MIRIAVLARPHCHGSGILGVMDFFATANFCGRVSEEFTEPLFDCQIVTVDDEPVLTYSGVQLLPTVSREHFQPDVIIIGAALETVLKDHQIDQSLNLTRPVFGWLQQAYRDGITLASICTGSFILAEAGLLEDQVATTHWRTASLFRRRYPKLRLEENQILVDNGQIICAGGATAFADLCGYLVERLASPAVALACSKLLLLDNRRSQQSPYMSFFGHKAHQDTAILKAQVWLEEHYAGPVSIDDVARVSGLGDRTFKRRFKEATGETALGYLQQLRIEAAKQQLESTRKQTASIIWEVGYEDASSFRRLFKRLVGCTMEQYRKRFSYEAPVAVAGTPG
ncbi:MAG: helix-turn-helix domain-containing protein [Gammaproteobacteria bacterium]|nr:MAG: helix-turn-helix domain-containing protein [Gammaproteobacteria bacterium]